MYTRRRDRWGGLWEVGGCHMCWVKATPRPRRVGTVGVGQSSLHPGEPFHPARSVTALVHPHPKASTWLLIWFFTLVFTMLFWFRTVPFKFSSPIWLNGGVPTTANIAKQYRASSAAVLAGQPHTVQGCYSAHRVQPPHVPSSRHSGGLQGHPT